MIQPRAAKRGFTLVEAAVATIVVVVISLAGAAYYANARIGEINEWHEQNALYLAEREVEAWAAAGYNGLNGFEQQHVHPNFLPYGYNFASPDGAWNQTGRYKDVTLNDFPYRIRARLFHNSFLPTSGTATDFFTEQSWNNGTGTVNYRYRQIAVYVQWGNRSTPESGQRLVQETRIAR